jgi:hypothetical protein
VYVSKGRQLNDTSVGKIEAWIAVSVLGLDFSEDVEGGTIWRTGLRTHLRLRRLHAPQMGNVLGTHF